MSRPIMTQFRAHKNTLSNETSSVHKKKLHNIENLINMFVQDNDQNMYVRNKTIHGTPIFVYTKATLTSIYRQTNDTHPRANTAKRSRT